jgi:hypothetical protein
MTVRSALATMPRALVPGLALKPGTGVQYFRSDDVNAIAWAGGC